MHGSSSSSRERVVRMAERRRAADYLRREYRVRERRGCRVLSLHRSSYRYRPSCRVSSDTHQAIMAESHRYAYWGYRKICEAA